nr:MAG TPA: cysteine-rich protein [Bacteriophage sp.]
MMRMFSRIKQKVFITRKTKQQSNTVSPAVSCLQIDIYIWHLGKWECPTLLELVVWGITLYKEVKSMYNNTTYDHIREYNGWGLCPVCGTKIVRLHHNTVLKNFPAWCKWCKREYVITRKCPKYQGKA